MISYGKEIMVIKSKTLAGYSNYTLYSEIAKIIVGQ